MRLLYSAEMPILPVIRDYISGIMDFDTPTAQVSVMLVRLERRDLVSSLVPERIGKARGRPRKVYSLTLGGKKALEWGCGSSRIPTSKRNRCPMENRPPKLVEFVVYYSAPFDSKAFLIDLRRRYRLRLRLKGKAAAHRLAYREALYWFLSAWIMQFPGAGSLLSFLSRIGPAS